MLTPTPTPLAGLHQHPDNPRTIQPGMLAELKTALERHPLMLEARPLIALPDGTVIAGNQRLRAAGELGWATIPVVTVDLDDTTAREWAIRDNNGFGDWEPDSLQRILNQLHDDDVPLPQLGFTDDQLRDILDGTNAGDMFGPPERAGEDTDPNYKLGHSTTKPGDIIRLGDHILVCGDAQRAEPYMAALEGEQAALVLTDPPYGVDYEGSDPDGPRGGKHHDALHGDQDILAYREALPLLNASSTADAPLLLWAADRHMRDVLAAATANGYEHRGTIIWVKTGGGVSAWAARYMPYHEPLLYLTKPGKTAWHGPSNERSVWEHPQNAKNEYHPTQKPVPLYERAITNHTEPGAIVLDPFAGSGTLAIACENQGRRAVMLELHPGFCDVVVDRWERHSGQEAERP